MKRNEIDMLHGSLAKGIIFYAIPVMLTSYLQLLFNAAVIAVVLGFFITDAPEAVAYVLVYRHMVKKDRSGGPQEPVAMAARS